MSSFSFNWKQFHKDVDMALALWLTEEPRASIHRELIDFLEYSNLKQLEEGEDL